MNVVINGVRIPVSVAGKLIALGVKLERKRQEQEDERNQSRTNRA